MATMRLSSSALGEGLSRRLPGTDRPGYAADSGPVTPEGMAGTVGRGPQESFRAISSPISLVLTLVIPSLMMS
jgi:hypothetical protein